MNKDHFDHNLQQELKLVSDQGVVDLEVVLNQVETILFLTCPTFLVFLMDQNLVQIDQVVLAGQVFLVAVLFLERLVLLVDQEDLFREPLFPFLCSYF